ncbi:MAG: sigma-E factor negative regulatory protein [Rubrivivax sp.]|nr:sigma-E factor negative regulatory protein [Rubrivivax sp.]
MTPQHTPPPAEAANLRECLSALADGRHDALDAACDRWSGDAEARRAWHEYHLIGDVLRSEDLASASGRDEAFLQAVRQRLATEPRIVAPSRLTAAARSATPRSSRQWALAAAAAGFLMVGGAVMSLREAEAPQSLAQGPAPLPGSAAPTRVVNAAPAGDPQWRALDGKMIRDERLDAYLRAHRGIDAARPGAVSGRFETVVLER